MTACTSFLAFLQSKRLRLRKKCIPAPTAGRKSSDLQAVGQIRWQTRGLSTIRACQKSLFDKLVDGGASSPATATSTIRNGRAAALTGSLATLPCLLGLLRPASATGGGLRAPPPVSAKILRISGRGNCKEAIFALENGIFRRKNRPVPAGHAAGDD